MMKLIEALKILNSAPSEGKTFRLFLACGFAPLHLQTLVAAEAQRAMPEAPVSIETGTYDDLVGNIQKLCGIGVDAACIAIEWPDLDPRLGVRRLSQWTHQDYSNVLQCAMANGERLFSEIERAAQQLPISVCFPTLRLLPHTFSPLAVTHPLVAELHLLVSGLEVRLLKDTRATVANRSRIDELSIIQRASLETDIQFGFPYAIEHASAVAQVLVGGLFQPPPKKAIITDLDDTLWSGLIGEHGIDQVHWDVEHYAQVHGIYQQALHSLAAEGVLIAVASRNSRELIQEAFHRRLDLLLSHADVLPFEVHWGSKSTSVANILRTWKIGEDSVVFVDDSTIELAEVKAAYPNIECLQFPRGNAQVFLEFWKRLRELFGRSAIHKEDKLRSSSLRALDTLEREASQGSTADDFLRGLQGELVFELSADPTDLRALELVNKTNQFNINGNRYTESSWRRALNLPGSFLLTATYRDRFGLLGKIAVMQGRVIKGSAVHVDCWVMSCRAFSRRIEFSCLARLFEQFAAEKGLIAYQPNDRNGPVAEFLKALDGGMQSPITITQAAFRGVCPSVFHRIEIRERVNPVEAQHA